MNLRMPDKRLVMMGFLASGAVNVYIDPRCSGVRLPDIFRRTNRACLAYGDCIPDPPADLAVTEEGISATLLLKGQPVFTQVPWKAVLYMETPAGGSSMWLDDYPADLRQELESAVDDAGLAEDVAEESAPLTATGGGSSASVVGRSRPDWLRLV